MTRVLTGFSFTPKQSLSPRFSSTSANLVSNFVPRFPLLTGGARRHCSTRHGGRPRMRKCSSKRYASEGHSSTDFGTYACSSSSPSGAWSSRFPTGGAPAKRCGGWGGSGGPKDREEGEQDGKAADGEDSESHGEKRTRSHFRRANTRVGEARKGTGGVSGALSMGGGFSRRDDCRSVSILFQTSPCGDSRAMRWASPTARAPGDNATDGNTGCKAPGGYSPLSRSAVDVSRKMDFAGRSRF